jgi:hypothetical protein
MDVPKKITVAEKRERYDAAVARHVLEEEARQVKLERDRVRARIYYAKNRTIILERRKLNNTGLPRGRPRKPRRVLEDDESDDSDFEREDKEFEEALKLELGQLQIQ